MMEVGTCGSGRVCDEEGIEGGACVWEWVCDGEEWRWECVGVGVGVERSGGGMGVGWVCDGEEWR